MELCVECQKRPIKHKKRKLCDSCYYKLWYADELPNLPRKHNLLNSEINNQPLFAVIRKNENKAEVLFGQNNPKMIYQPATFCLPIGKYTPDFYDAQTNTFIEIIGSRQRYHQLLAKLTEFKKMFPKIKFQILCGDGKPYKSRPK